MKNDNMFSNELDCQDARLASSSHPMTCFVLCIREDWIKPNRTEVILQRTALCWSWKKKPSALAQRWTPGWLEATGEQLNWRLQNLADLATDGNNLFLRATIVSILMHFERSICQPFNSQPWKDIWTPKIEQNLTQSSKSHYSWHTLGTRLCHNEWIISCRFRDGSWTLHRDTPISQDLKLCLFLSFHGLFPYDALRAKLVIGFQAPVTCIASKMLVASLCHRRGIWGSSDCSLLIPAAHPVQWIRGKSSASRLNTSLVKTTSHCYLAAQNFLTLLPSWWKLYNPVLRGKQSCWVLVVGLFISLACFYIAGVYSWLAWYFKENSCEFERRNPLHEDVFCCLLCCWV